MKSYCWKKTVALIGAAVLALSPLGAFTPVMAVSGDEPGALAANAPLTAPNGTANPDNALPDEAYKDFGFQSLPSQEAFTSDEQPLDGFEGTAMSQLYVGYMNKSKSQQGSYAVYDAMPRRSAQGATISGSGAAGYLDAVPVSAPTGYPGLSGVGQVEDGKYRTLNSVSLDMGGNSDGSGGKREVICESILLTGKERNVKHAKQTSWLCVRALVNPGKGYMPANSKYIKLAESNAGVGSIDVRAARGLNAVAAGDYDGDGIDELAVYVPDFNEPFIQLYDVAEDGGLSAGPRISLNDLAAPNDPYQYCFGFSGWNLPIVYLATSGLARGEANRDHLVVSACLPRSDAKAYKGHSQLAALAVYEQNGASMKRLFVDHLDYGSYYMRFPAAVEADLNGNKTGELVVAGYADTWTDATSQKLSEHPFEKFCVNLMAWDKDAKAYRMAYTTPLAYAPTGDVKKAMKGDSGYAMSEPVALAAAVLSEVTDNDFLLLEGAVLSFSASNNAKKTDGELLQLAGGKLTGRFEMKMNPSAVSVSHAVSGRFAADRPGSEQIALVWNDNYHNPNAVVDGNITWLWTKNNIFVQHDANYQYLKGRDADGSGTFLSLARVDDTAHRVTYKYKKKSYGWSAPNALIALPAVPYWKELPYDGGVGDVTFTVGNELDGSVSAGMSVSSGITGSISAMAGAGALGNKAIAGLGADFDASVESAAQLQAGLSVGNTQTYSAPGDKNHVLAYATPMVTYEYDVWLPSFTVTEETAKKYKELTGSDVLKNEDGTVYTVGQTVSAGWYSYNLHVPYSPTFTLITMDQYNEAYQKHALGTGKIDMNAYGFTVGDPTTYKSGFSDIPHYNSVLNMKSRPKYITANDVDNGIEFDSGASVSGSAMVALQVSGSVQGKVEAEINFFGAGKLEGSAGQTGGLSSSITGELGFSFSMGAGASISHLPSGYGDYSFETTMGVWPCIGHGALLTTGFIVAPKTDIPPKPPENPYVYQTGMQENGKAFLVLAWERPTATDYRLASEYEVFFKNVGAPAGDYRSLGKVKALEQNFMPIADLEPDKTYDFAFKPLLPGSHGGGLSKPLSATTAKAATLAITKQPDDVYEAASSGAFTANFSIAASDSDPGKTLSYQWQRCETGGGYVGEWADVGTSTQNYSTTLQAENADGLKYRCVVSSKTDKGFLYSADTQTVISRAATVHTGGVDPRFSVELSAQGEGGTSLAREQGGAYFLPAGGKATLKAEVTKAGVPGVGDGAVSLYCSKDGGAETLIKSGLTPVNGIVTYEWTPAQTGEYNLAAVYTVPGGSVINSVLENKSMGAAPNAVSTPDPNATNTPDPNAVSTPDPNATATPDPNATNTPDPNATNTPDPNATNTPDPNATATPDPNATATPDTTAVEPAGKNTLGLANLHKQAVDMLALSAPEGELDPAMTISPKPASMTDPNATSTPDPNATSTPDPNATSTPDPNATATPDPNATATPDPNATATPDPNATATPDPNATATPDPNATATPDPNATATTDTTEAGTPNTLKAGAAINALNTAKIAVSEPIAIHVGTIADEAYFIRYELNGGTNNAANPHAIGRNAAPIALAAPTRTGAAFEGWYEDAGFSQKIEYLDPVRIEKKLAGGSGPYLLYANWTAAEYDITYELDGGANHPDNPDKYTLLGGAVLREPEKTGYRFTGWFFDSSNPAGADVDGAKPVYSLPLVDKQGDWVAAGVTLRAKWEAIEYPIIYHVPLAAGNGANPDTYTVEDTVALNPADYTGRPFRHDGWYTEAEYTHHVTQIAAGTTGPLSLYAKPGFLNNYIYFDALGGVYEDANPKVVNAGTSFRLGAASRQGYDFKTWSERANLVDGERVADESATTHNALSAYSSSAAFSALYAAWTPAAGQVELHWLDPSDGEEIYLNHGVKGQKIADPGVTPVHYGYAFDGKWYRDQALTQQWDFANDVVPTSLADALTLYAGLREIYYTVAFEPNGGSAVPSQPVQEGKTAIKPPDPSKPNQIFIGWYRDSALAIPYDFALEVQSDLTLYAKWRDNGPVRPVPGVSKILGIEEGKEYPHGVRMDFTAVGAGMDNIFPVMGDERHVPKSWSVNPSGTWSGPPYAASFETRDMAEGAHTLTVTFALERYENGAWKDTSGTVQIQVSFNLAKGAPGVTPPPGGSSPEAPASAVVATDEVKTGDDTDINLYIALALVAAAAVISVAAGLRRKTLK